MNNETAVLRKNIISLYLNIGLQANKQIEELKTELNNTLTKIITTQNCISVLNEFMQSYFSNEVNLKDIENLKGAKCYLIKELNEIKK